MSIQYKDTNLGDIRSEVIAIHPLPGVRLQSLSKEGGGGCSGPSGLRGGGGRSVWDGPAALEIPHRA